MAVINSHNGIIAGIGDKSIGVNVIPPEFDARIRAFLAGKNCIIDGFEYESGYLTSGRCIAEGYVGECKVNTKINRSDYVYGVFTVNHDKDVLDSFHLEIHDSELLDPQKDDILNVAGKYYFQIYPKTDEKKYPLKAEYSDNTTIVQANGKLENGVTCHTQELNDNSTKVANTKYVHNQIVEELAEDKISDEIKHSIRHDITTIGSISGKYTIIKRANFCIATIELNSVNNNELNNFVLFSVPDNFKPQSERMLYSYTLTQLIGTSYTKTETSKAVIQLNQNGEVSFTCKILNSSNVRHDEQDIVFVAGYKLYDN